MPRGPFVRQRSTRSKKPYHVDGLSTVQIGRREAQSPQVLKLMNEQAEARSGTTRHSLADTHNAKVRSMVESIPQWSET